MFIILKSYYDKVNAQICKNLVIHSPTTVFIGTSTTIYRCLASPISTGNIIANLPRRIIVRYVPANAGNGLANNTRRAKDLTTGRTINIYIRGRFLNLFDLKVEQKTHFEVYKAIELPLMRAGFAREDQMLHIFESFVSRNLDRNRVQIIVFASFQQYSVL